MRALDIEAGLLGISSAGAGDLNLGIGFVTIVGFPRATLNLSVTANETSLDISWDSNGNPGGSDYDVMDTSTSQVVASTTSTSTTISSLDPNTQYCYKTRACDWVCVPYTASQCRYTLPTDAAPSSSSHSVGVCSNDDTVDLSASADSNHFFYVWDQNQGTAVSASDTWWSGSAATKTATADGNWYLHVASANPENAFSDGGTQHLGQFTIDTEPPATTDDANTQWQGSNQTVILTPSDVGCGLDNTHYCVDTANTCTPDTNGTSVSVSCDANSVCQQYTRYYSADKAGFTETTHSVLVKVDKQPPTTSSDANTQWQGSDQTVNFTVNDSSGAGGDTTYYCIDDSNTCTPDTLNSSAVVSCDANTVCQKYLRFKSKDYVDNMGSVQSVLISIDKNKPFTSSDANTQWQGSDQTITLTPSDATGSGIANTYYCTDESNTCSPATVYTAPFQITCAADSVCPAQYARYYSTDSVGNNESVHSKLIKIDKQLPSTTDDSNTIWQKNNVVVELSPGDGSGSGVQFTYYCIDTAGTCTPATSGTSVSVSCDANSACQKYVRYHSVDNVNNTEAVNTSNLIRIDKNVPYTADDSNGYWRKDNLAVTLSPVDGSGSGIASTHYCIDTANTCTPDTSGTSASVTCASDSACPTKYVRYRSTDNAGNQETTKSALVKIDKEAPTTSDNAPEGLQADNVTVTLTPSDGSGSGIAATYYCVDDSNSCTPTDSGTSADANCPVNSECTKYVRYYSTDNVGNIESTNYVLVQIEKRPPSTYSNITGEWLPDNFTVTITCVPTSASCSQTIYRLNSGSWTVYSSSFIVSASGVTQVDYNSQDEIGNYGDINTAYVRIDRTAPSTTDDANTLWQSEDLQFTLSPSDSQSGVKATYQCTDTTNTCTPDTNSTSVSVTCAAGSHCRKYVRYYSTDDVNNDEGVKSLLARVDKRNPVCLAEGPSGCMALDFNVILTCTDENGSGRYIIRYRFDSDEWADSPVLQQIPSDWWDLNWARRRKIVFDNSGESVKSNYSVLLRLNSGNFHFLETQSSGQDLRFFDDDHETELQYFIDTFSRSQRDAVVWIKVPQIDAGSTTDHIWMYYSNFDADANQASNWFN